MSGSLLDPSGNVVPAATIRLLRLADSSAKEILTNSQGQFFFTDLNPGEYRLSAEFPGFTVVTRTIALADDQARTETVHFSAVSSRTESVTITADVTDLSISSPDPAERVFVREDLLDANPGRPGAPVSIPGYPVETAASGIKAPQYFAPGVAGDHGEPIAQFIAVGGYLVPNNLSANAHGNGYADPNIFVPQVLESVQIDSGAFNVREGNHSVNLAATYGLRSHVESFFTLAGDCRDADLATGFSPGLQSWLVFEASYGNGLLDRVEHRQQYKFNGERFFDLGAHRLTLFGIGYYGQSYVPGLVPIFPENANDINLPNYGDTIDPRQKDQTHTALVALNDAWRLSDSQELQLSGFFRTYNLSLYSDFGQGLIRQSEFRTVGGASAEHVKKFTDFLSLLAGLDYEREAPRRDDLDHYGFFDPTRPAYYGPFAPIDGNNVTIGSTTPYIAAEGNFFRHISYYLGWRRDEISIDNQDLLASQNSFQKLIGVNSPKATFSFLPGDSRVIPLVSLSFGEAFFTEDPRIGLGNSAGTPVARSHSYQVVASKTARHTDVRLTLGHVMNSAELAKIDPDTGLPFNQGPSRLRFMTFAVRHSFSIGSVQASLSKADARDLDTGDPTPEAPRTIFDFLGTVQKLPLHFEAKGEFEFVSKKPLGTGCDVQNMNAECTGTSVKEFRGALVRPFLEGRVDAGINFLIARGYTGQTTENFYPSMIQEVVGVRIPSYASMSFTY
ncbi:MAG TPA: TonB-dependent receptor, partial [Pyrinomonadaceae bacterium]|nr:TonB-dependent receptor [Pyrinomonadaceae bacterium]